MPHNKASQYMKQQLMKPQGETDKLTIKVDYFALAGVAQ